MIILVKHPARCCRWKAISIILEIIKVISGIRVYRSPNYDVIETGNSDVQCCISCQHNILQSRMMPFIRNYQVIIISIYDNIVNDSQCIAFTEIYKDVCKKRERERERF